jgi:hypothetical protein
MAFNRRALFVGWLATLPVEKRDFNPDDLSFWGQSPLRFLECHIKALFQGKGMEDTLHGQCI